jgi:hypothetical protein
MCSNLFFAVKIMKLRGGGEKILITWVSKVNAAMGA